MLTNNYETDIANLEDNLNNIEILFMYVDNFKITNYEKEKLLTKNNTIKKNAIISLINNKLKNEYKIEYLIKFYFKIDEYYLGSNNKINKDDYIVETIKEINDLDFNDSSFNYSNKLIIFLNKINDFIIKNPNITKKNKTKKIKITR